MKKITVIGLGNGHVKEITLPEQKSALERRKVGRGAGAITE